MLSKLDISGIFVRRNAIITNNHFVYAKKADGWYHGTDYVNKDAIYPYVDDVSILCREIASHFVNRGIDVVIGPTVGAVSLAQWTTHWLNNLPHARNRQALEVLAVCADEENVLEERELCPEIPQVCPKKPPIMIEFSATEKVAIETVAYFGYLVIKKIKYFEKIAVRRIIKRGYDKHVQGKRCLIVEDIINSGATVAKTREAVLRAGGEVVGVGCLCNRSGGKVTANTLCVPELFSLLDVNMEMFKEENCPVCQEKGRGSVRLDLGKGKDFLVRLGLKPEDK